MKKISLIMLGLAFIFTGLQSFVKADETASENTILTTVDENWSTDDVEETDQVLAATWRIVPCTTPQGLPGTTCAWSGNATYPVCFNPRNAKYLCTGYSNS